MRRVKDPLRITRPFAIFIEPAPDTEGWIAHVVGQQLDNVTCGDDAASAAYMAADLIRMLCGECEPPNKDHDWAKQIVMFETGKPGWVCSHCGERADESAIEECDP